MKNIKKPFYIKFPVFQIAYFILWMPLGIVISYICSLFFISIVYTVLIFVLSKIYPIAFKSFVLTGAIDVIGKASNLITMFSFDFIFLILGLEVITYIIKRKSKKDETGE